MVFFCTNRHEAEALFRDCLQFVDLRRTCVANARNAGSNSSWMFLENAAVLPQCATIVSWRPSQRRVVRTNAISPSASPAASPRAPWALGAGALRRKAVHMGSTWNPSTHLWPRKSGGQLRTLHDSILIESGEPSIEHMADSMLDRDRWKQVVKRAEQQRSCELARRIVAARASRQRILRND